MSNNHKQAISLVILGSTMMLFAVAIGAFGAHGIKPKISTTQLSTFSTGSLYHFFHSLAILLLAGLTTFLPPHKLMKAAKIFFVGILLFSGSLYLLATRDLLGISHWKFLGPLTPIGGLCFLSAWAYLIYISFVEFRK